MTRREWIGLISAFAVACAGANDDAPLPDVTSDPASNFRTIYADPVLRERFALFLLHVFHLYPEDRFHALIHRLSAENSTDERIYLALLQQLPEISPPGAVLTHALPTLKKQKEEMAKQVASVIGRSRVDGYLEMGTTGRYLGALRQHLTVEGPVFVLNDVAPSRDPADIVDRGQIRDIGDFLPLGNYDPVGPAVPDGSLDLVSDLIGLHHCPETPLEAFVVSLRRVLKPGGLLVLREHDVGDATMSTFVALAHDVFNAGIGLSWAENHAQVRRFRSATGWTQFITAQGFERITGEGRQVGDPTDNLVLAFRKV